MRSLRSRLSIGLAASLAAVFAVQWLVVTLAIREVAESYVASRLEHDSDSLLAALVFGAAGRPALQGARLGAMFEQPYSGLPRRDRAQRVALALLVGPGSGGGLRRSRCEHA